VRMGGLSRISERRGEKEGILISEKGGEGGLSFARHKPRSPARGKKGEKAQSTALMKKGKRKENERHVVLYDKYGAGLRKHPDFTGRGGGGRRRVNVHEQQQDGFWRATCRERRRRARGKGEGGRKKRGLQHVGIQLVRGRRTRDNRAPDGGGEDKEKEGENTFCSLKKRREGEGPLPRRLITVFVERG